MIKIFFFVIMFVACKPTESAPHTGPVSCSADSDCHVGACGPCGVGEAITEDSLMQECVVNPCPNHTAACVNHVCTIAK